MVAIAAVLLIGSCGLAPFLYLTYQRHRIDRFCGSITKGEPIADVSRRAREQRFDVLDAQLLDPGMGGELLVSTDFLLAHLICSVRHEGQRVDTTQRGELW